MNNTPMQFFRTCYVSGISRAICIKKTDLQPKRFFYDRSDRMEFVIVAPKSRGRYEKNRVPCTVSRDETRTHFMHAYTLVQIDDKEHPLPKEMTAQGDQKAILYVIYL